jgi:tetratricopeptide (TPR) repeat protein
MPSARGRWFSGEYLQAESDIKRALELDPNNALAHAYYVEILVDSFYSGLGSFEGIEKAIEESKWRRRLLQCARNPSRARLSSWKPPVTTKKPCANMKPRLRSTPTLPTCIFRMGRNYRILGIYDKAVESFTRANALNPEDPLPDLYMSRTYATIGEYGKAMQYAESAVADDPADTNLRGNLGVMYYRNAYWPEAVEQLAYVSKAGFPQEGNKWRRSTSSQCAARCRILFHLRLALSRLNQCGEALQIAQLIISRVPSDELAVNNANAIIEPLPAKPCADARKRLFPRRRLILFRQLKPTPTP